jgi:starch synthase
VLQNRRDVLSGILNGVDYGQWNPATDRNLPANYGVDNFAQGKAACKAALQHELGLPAQPRTPLVGLVGRLTDQKGIDIVVEVLRDWLPSVDAQWAILGKGEPKHHEALTELAQRHPGRLAVRLEYSDALAHRIEGGADLFLMPSRFEPCGLSQMYSLKYGTVPVVRETGGLADTITDARPDALAAGTANGFSFREDRAEALAETLQRALDAYRRPEVWDRLVGVGMRQDWSWDHSAREYVTLYEQTVARARRPAPPAG